ncbi:MAG TPA: 2-oxo acid dehydrogenase subunit E2 [Clostridia bacterium]|nr:2-oxo acid dehydrogenase subunit E2 [Clostridia bacterium]
MKDIVGKPDKEAELLVGEKGLWKDLHYTRERFKIMRKIVAHITTESWEKIPHCSFNYDPDVTEFMEEYKILKNKHLPQQNITFNSLMLKVIVEGLKAAPHLNAYVQYNKVNSRGTVDIIEEINISMPIKVDEENTITVNVQNTHNKSLTEINDYVADVRRKAANTNLDELYYRVAFKQSMEELREFKIPLVIRRLFVGRVGKDKVHPLTGKAKKEYDRIPETDRLTIADVRQGTLVVSNIGPLLRNSPVTVGLLEVVPPQAIAIAITAAQEKPVFVLENGEKVMKPRLLMSLCVAFDHRAYDFDAMVPFIEKLDEIFANPKIIHEW